MIRGDWLWLLVDGLACFRLAHLIAVDKITDRPRQALLNKAKRAAFDHATAHHNAPTSHDSNLYGKLWEMLICPWCNSIWLAIPIVTVTKLIPGVWQYPAMGLTLSAIAGLCAGVS